MAGDRFLPKTEYIFREGESAEYAYVLKEGTIEIIKTGLDGDIVLNTIDTPNALFGEMALIDGAPRSAGARAKTDATVTEVSQADFLAYVQQNPAAAMNIMKNLSKELRTANMISAAAIEGDGEDASDQEVLRSEKSQTPDDIDDTDAIYETPTSKPIMYTSVTLLLLFLTAIIFTSVAAVDTTVSARGKFTTKVPNVEVQATSSAVVRKLLIKRGQIIKKGELVVVLDSTVAEADLKSNKEKRIAVKGRLQRLKLERSLLTSKKKVPASHGLDPLNLDILSKTLQQYRSKMNSFRSKVRKLDKEIITAKAEVGSAKETVISTNKQLIIKKKMEAARKKLYDSKHGSLLNYLQAQDASEAAQQAYFKSKNDVDSKVAAMTSKKNDKVTLLADRGEFVAKWSSGLGEKLAKEGEAFIQLSQEGLKLTQNVENVEVRSPVNGIVLDIPTVAVGSIVREGDGLITLVLVDQPMTLEVDVDPKDISDVKLNIPVSVKLDALPFQQYGDLNGSLKYMSQDTYTESLSGEKGAFYRGRVDIPAKELATVPSGFRLTPGMLASADMKVGERRIITYLTHPIMKGFSSAFSEPD